MNVCWKIIHLACMAASSRLSSYTLEAFSKGTLWGKRAAGCLPFFRRSSVVAGKGAMGSPFLSVAPAIWGVSTL